MGDNPKKKDKDKKKKKRERQRSAKKSANPPQKKKWWKTTWAFIGYIILLLTGLSTLKPVKELFMSKHAIYQEENFATGTIKPALIKEVDLEYDTLELKDRPIFNKARRDTFPIVKGVKVKTEEGDMLHIAIGTGIWTIGKDVVKKGIKIFDPVTSNGCAQTKLHLILKDGRIYASAEFRDLKNGDIVGNMEYNYWKLYLPNLSDYDYEDDRLEVKDKQGYVIFSILFSDKGQAINGVIALSGYFMNPNSVLIVNSDPVPKFYDSSTREEMLSKKVCITKDSANYWKGQAEEYISKIVSVFDYK